MLRSDPTDFPDPMGASSLGQPDLLSGLDSYGASGGNRLSDTDLGTPLCVSRGWKPPLLGKLPANFLRIRPLRHAHSYNHPDRTDSVGGNNTAAAAGLLSQDLLHERMVENQKRLGSMSLHHDTTASSATAVDQQQQQLLEDEKFALMLQNKEFMSELRGNHEFLSTLEEDLAPTTAASAGGGLNKKSSSGVSNLGMDEALFRERLKNMGKQSKQKFTKLANMFTRQKGGATRLLGHAPAPSKDNLLLNAEPLVDPHESDSDEEEKHSTTKVICTILQKC